MSAASALGAEAKAVKASISLPELIRQTLPLKRSGRHWTANCPFHAENTPSFFVYFDHYHCFGCGSRGDCFDWLRHISGMTLAEAVAHLGGGPRQNQTVAPPTSRLPPEPRETGNHDLARKLWTESVDPYGTPVQAYLRYRGLDLPTADGLDIPDEPDVIRFHPKCPSPFGRLPAMMALMTDPQTGQARGIHRTLLREDGQGKADVDKPKLMLGNAGIIALDQWQGDGLGLAEGVETALAVAQKFEWRPVWAAGSAGAIRKFPVLPFVSLSIFADADTNGTGLAAARDCARRYAAAGQHAIIHVPPSGRDWDDQGRDFGDA